MKHYFLNLLSNKNNLFLFLSFLFLLAGLSNPTLNITRGIYNFILIVDISQSMNTQDMKLDNKNVSRLEYSKSLMNEIVEKLPCKTKVSIGMFAGVSVSATYSPIEVCANFNNLNATIKHLDWRNTWSGNTRIRESVVNLARLIRSFPESAQVVFFTDGEEAPKLHAFNTRDLTQFQDGKNWLFVGIGSKEGTPIPKYDSNNQLIGYWSNESFALQPGIAQISESNIGARDDSVAGGTNDRYLSKLDEDYLKKLTQEISAKYIQGKSSNIIIERMNELEPAWKAKSKFHMKPILIFISLLFFILRFINLNQITQWRFKSN